MKRTFALCLIATLCSALASAQVKPADTAGKPILRYVEQMPATDYNLNKYLSENIRYPEKARRHNKEGRVLIKFVVDEYGSIVDAHLLNSVDELLDEEALRVVKSMPPWRPGIQDGKPVKVYFTLPIVFKLEDRKHRRNKSEANH